MAIRAGSHLVALARARVRPVAVHAPTHEVEQRRLLAGEAGPAVREDDGGEEGARRGEGDGGVGERRRKGKKCTSTRAAGLLLAVVLCGAVSVRERPTRGVGVHVSLVHREGRGPRGQWSGGRTAGRATTAQSESVHRTRL